jgi:hypothetical protein
MATRPENWEAVKALFEAALEEDSAYRSSFLKERCPDANLRAEVERLLAEHDQAGSFLSTPVLALPLDAGTPPGGWPGGLPRVRCRQDPSALSDSSLPPFPFSSHSQLLYPPISPEIGHVATRLVGSLFLDPACEVFPFLVTGKLRDSYPCLVIAGARANREGGAAETAPRERCNSDRGEHRSRGTYVLNHLALSGEVRF